MTNAVRVEDDSVLACARVSLTATQNTKLLCSTRLTSNDEERWGSLLVLWLGELLREGQGRLETVSGYCLDERVATDAVCT